MMSGISCLQKTKPNLRTLNLLFLLSGSVKIYSTPVCMSSLTALLVCQWKVDRNAYWLLFFHGVHRRINSRMRFIHLFLRNREAREVAIQSGVIIIILVNLIFRVLIWFRWKKNNCCVSMRLGVWVSSTHKNNLRFLHVLQGR